MPTLLKAKYNCTQAELYPICRLGWNTALKYQADIVIKFPVYTIPYITGKIADIQTAEDLPDFQSRDLAPETAHILLKHTATPAIQNRDLLARYINAAFKTNKELIKPNVEAAGSQYREAATRENPNWEDLEQMLKDGKKYITDNLAVLTPVIPPAFPADFDAAKTAFDAQYNTFTNAETDAPAGTITKITANNAIYDELMFMLDDLYTIAPPEEKINMNFTYLKGIISSPGPAGLKGTITKLGTDVPVAGALLRLLEKNYETSSAADGKYDFGNIASGKYTLEISEANYQTLKTELTVDTGVTSTKNFQLTPTV